MIINKHISSFTNNYESFIQSILREDIFVSKNKITLFDSSFAEKIVSRQISHDKISLIDRIKNFVLHIFSKEFRKSKKIIKANLVRFRKQYFREISQSTLNPLKKEDGKIHFGSDQIQKKKEEFKAKDTTNYIANLPEDVTIEILSHLHRDDIQRFRRTCSQFKNIHKSPILLAKLLENNMPFSQKELISLSKYSGHLVKKLTLHNPLFLNDRDVGLLLNFYPNLQNLNLTCENLSDAILDSIANLKNLKELYLWYSQFNDQSIKKIAHLKLEKMVVDDVNITDEGMEIISNYKSLKGIAIFGSPITDKGFEKLLKLNHLEALYLCGCDQLTDLSVEKIIEKKSLLHVCIAVCKQISPEAIDKIDVNVWDSGHKTDDYFFLNLK